MNRRIQEKGIRVERKKEGREGGREERCLARAVHVFLAPVSDCLFVR